VHVSENNDTSNPLTSAHYCHVLLIITLFTLTNQFMTDVRVKQTAKRI